MITFVLSLPSLCGELWASREQLAFFVWRDIKVRHKETILGLFWVILQPLLTMFVFTLFLGRWAPSGHTPYAIFALSGLIPWTFFSNGVRQASNSILGNSNLVKKIYFPRLLLPLASLCSQFVDYLVGVLLLLLVMPFFGQLPKPHVIPLLLSLILMIGTAFGAGLWFAVFNSKFRDAGHLLPFLTQLWFFSSPVAYTARALPRSLVWAYHLNPLVGTIQCFRAAFVPQCPWEEIPFLLGLASMTLLCASGLLLFRQAEPEFADRI